MEYLDEMGGIPEMKYLRMGGIPEISGIPG